MPIPSVCWHLLFPVVFSPGQRTHTLSLSRSLYTDTHTHTLTLLDHAEIHKTGGFIFTDAGPTL